MKNIKKILAGLTAVSVAGSLAACSGGGEPAETTAAITTTPAVTVEINTETLSQEEQEQINSVADQLTGELENKTIKWFSFYDPFHPTTSGNTKALSLELFEAKYDGKIEYIETTWQNRFNDLSTRIIGGDGIDFIAGGDLDSFPKGIPSGQFESYDSYIDWSNPLWAEWKDLNDKFIVNGKHYIICPQSTLGQVVVYNRGTVEAMGFDDPAELFEKGEWNWDTFKGMLLDYVDPAQDQYGLDGWFNEQPLMLTSGVPSVELKDGKLVHNLNDPNLERVMNFMYSLSTSELVLDKSLFSWTEHPEFIGEGRELFYIGGMYVLEGAPEVWTATFGNQEDVMFVPLPKDPESSEHYVPAGLEAYMLCKGAQNPEGVMRFMECILAANADPQTQEIGVNKLRNDYGWREDMIEMRDKITELARKNPVYDIHTGCPTDLYDILDSGEYGIRAAFYGHDWATTRESLLDVTDIYINEFNEQVEAMG